MATQAQIDANRANAQRSTGPKTEEGKTRASQNAFKTGLYSEAEIAKNEDPAQLEHLRAEYYTAHPPATPEARDLLDDIVQDVWRKRRLRRAESQYWDHLQALAEKPDPDLALGQAFHLGNLALSRAERMLESIGRHFLRNLDRLHDLESAAAPPEPASPADPESSTAQPTEESTPNPEIGFVSSMGQKFASEAEWRATYHLRPRHPLNHNDCPVCRFRGRNTFHCGYEPPKRGSVNNSDTSEG